ncbi:MAG: hypothetical protein KF894_29615 [Labilithrix sp.]|nr:hypothetical protein [Labilithrix sp.]
MTPAAVLDVVRQLLAIVLSLVPKEVAVQLLTEESVKRQNTIADLTEVKKFGGRP